jgi:propanol-preferring alcohol dehydrogenase
MRAMQLQSPAPIDQGPLVPVEVAHRPPGPGELLVAVAACAVCRTDVQLIEGDLPARRLPIVPGHQAVGRVVAVGDNVSDWSVGDRAGIGWLAGTCGACEFCVSGRENLCAEAEFTGWDRDGGYGETVLGRADFALRLPDGPTDRELAPLLCGGVIGYRSLVVSGIQPGQRLGLFGFGASASLAIQVARHWDCEVYVATRSESEQHRAQKLGAGWAGGYDDPMPAPLHAAVTFAPVGTVVVSALTALAPGGTVAINAIHLDRIPEFDYSLLWRERQVRSVANYTRADAAEFLALAAGIPIRTTIDEYPLAEANTALARLKAGETNGTAVLIP